MDPLFRERDLAARRNENVYLNKQSIACTGVLVADFPSNSTEPKLRVKGKGYDNVLISLKLNLTYRMQ